MTDAKLLRKIVDLLAEVQCQSSGCYAPKLGGHVRGCIRARAEKLSQEIGYELERQRQTRVQTEIGL